MSYSCNTKYVFVGDETEIADFHSQLERICDNNDLLVDENFGEMSLKNLALIYKIDCDTIDCSGNIGCYELESPTRLRLETLTIHRERNDVFIRLLTNYPSIQCYYSTENQDSRYYATNDYGRQYFPERFIIKQGGEEPEYCNDLPAFFKSISNRLLTNTDTKEKVVCRVSKWNMSHDYQDQIEVNEIMLVDDLCQKRVKTLIYRMEQAVKDSAGILYSHSFYRDVDFVARTLGGNGFVWVILPRETILYQNDIISDIELLLHVMDHCDKNKTPYQIHHHHDKRTLYPRHADAIREWAKKQLLIIKSISL